MTAKELWNKFTSDTGIAAQYESWAFGTDADTLADLVLRGVKTATASAYPLYAIDGDDLPKVGEYSVILDSRDTAVCIIKTTKVFTAPFCDIGAEQAYKEGEGDRSLDYWRQVHREFFTECMNEAGLEFSEDMLVVCEEFEVMYRS